MTNLVKKALTAEVIGLAAVLVIALTFRLWHLGTVPYGFHNDELMNGYVGRFILQNGLDLYGHKWPLLYFDNFGDYPNVIPMYISGATTFILGVSELAVRLPIALVGSMGVLPVYYLARLTIHDKKWSLLASLLVALTPWHIVLSRATSEGILAATVFLTGACLMLYGNKRQSITLLLSSAPFFLLTYFLISLVPHSCPTSIAAGIISLPH